MTRILIIEDEENIALALKEDLELEEYEIDVLTSGDEACQKVQADDYDLVLLDLILPGKDGYDVCRELRRSGDRTPIIMLTARTQEAEKVLGLDLGADDYITKPFSPMELRARIRAVLRRSKGLSTNSYAFDEFEVDIDRFELRKDSAPIKLTPIEMKLLIAFVRHPGQVLARDTILDLIWGSDVFITDRVVDTHISNLRKKIEPEGSEEPKYIINVRGMGYRFDG